MERSFATRADDAEFAGFCCCDGEAPPWRVEVENYVRGHVLGRATHSLAFREKSELIAVAAFDPKTIELARAVDPLRMRGWKLQVVAVARERQRQGLSGDVFAQTFEAMREQDPTRGVVQADVHVDNDASLAACERAGLVRVMPIPPEHSYWLLMGKVPGIANELTLE